MTPKQLRIAQRLLAQRQAVRDLIEATEGMSAYALEMRFPKIDGRVFVFSNDQPGAGHELTIAMNDAACAAVRSALAAEILDINGELQELGLDPDASESDDADAAADEARQAAMVKGKG